MRTKLSLAHFMIFFYSRRSSHGVATSVFLRQGTEVFLQHQSSNGNDFQDGADAGDCIYDTKFFYGQFNAWLVFATEIKDEQP